VGNLLDRTSLFTVLDPPLVSCLELLVFPITRHGQYWQSWRHVPSPSLKFIFSPLSLLAQSTPENKLLLLKLQCVHSGNSRMVVSASLMEGIQLLVLLMISSSKCQFVCDCSCEACTCPCTHGKRIPNVQRHQEMRTAVVISSPRVQWWEWPQREKVPSGGVGLLEEHLIALLEKRSVMSGIVEVIWFPWLHSLYPRLLGYTRLSSSFLLLCVTWVQRVSTLRAGLCVNF